MKRFWLATYNLLHISANTLVAITHRIYSSVSSQLFTIKKICYLLLLLISTTAIFAQPVDNEQKQVEYKKVVTERVVKIINTLEINDSNKYNKVLSLITNQYFQLNTIHEESKEATAEIKTKSLIKEETEAALKMQEQKKVSILLQQHEAFIAHLKEQLTETQVDKVKDGMTYRVFPITYSAYQDMLPSLTAEQKEKIYNWLKEARELAMDAESSDKKHAVFGKYKGKINNYLSAAGYDMKKKGEEWQKRIKERTAAEKGQQRS
jgi:Protein of unknown function (DUF3826)